MDAKTVIDSVASGKALEAKESLNSLLSARAFEALDAKKIELAQALFSTTDQIENEEEISKEEVEQIDELSPELKARYLYSAQRDLATRPTLAARNDPTHKRNIGIRKVKADLGIGFPGAFAAMRAAKRAQEAKEKSGGGSTQQNSAAKS